MSDPTIKGLGPAPTSYDGSPFRIAIIHARWNHTVIESLVKGCIEKLKEAGVKENNIVIKSVPGSYELPFACQKLIEGGKTQSAKAAPSMISSTTNLLSLIDSSTTGTGTGTSTPKDSSSTSPTTTTTAAASSGPSTAPFNAVIAIGVLLKGSTMHFEYIADTVSHGLMKVQLDSGTPVIFGVLTCMTEDQALERAGIGRKGDKGHNHGEDWALAAVEASAQCADWAKGQL